MCARIHIDVITITLEGLSKVDESQKIFARRFGLSWPSPTEVDLSQLTTSRETTQRTEETCDGPIVIVGMVVSGCVQRHDGQWRIVPLTPESKGAEDVDSFTVPPDADLLFSRPLANISHQEWMDALNLYLPTACSQQVADFRRQRQYSNPN